jgi:citrate lyase subunit beta/citryl-CoA lyase
LHVHIEPRDRGGIAIELQSRVKPYYGDSIQRQAEEVLEALGVRHAQVQIHDEGALPFVIAARIEAAVKRAGWGQGTRVLPDRVPLPEASSRDRLRRSRLYVPGSEPKYFINAALHGPDAIILDLEDSVHPGEKDAARLLVRNALRAVDFLRCERMVRINQLPLGLEDLDEIVPESPDLILIPKVENPEQMVEAGARIADIKADYGITRPIWLMPILESALGIENALAIAQASETIVALTIGLEDYTSDLGVVKTPDGAESLYARQRVVNAAHAAGVQAIDSVFGDVGDIEGLRVWGLNSRALGFEGMGCVHPVQIPVIHDAFAPTPLEIERARKIVAAYNDAHQKGLGVVSLGSKMIDPPVVQRALKLMARAQAMGIPKV